MIKVTQTRVVTALTLVAVSLISACANSSLKSSNQTAPPSPMTAAAPTASETPMSFTKAERVNDIRRLTSSELHPRTADETRQLVEHLEVLSKGKDAKSRFFAKQLPFLQKYAVTLDEAERNADAVRLCSAESQDEVLQSIKTYLNDSLNDPSSLQDMKILKCVPTIESGQMVNLKLSYRAKNSFGALVLSSEVFIIMRDSSGKLLGASSSELEKEK